jgi:hypothetical protein
LRHLKAVEDNQERLNYGGGAAILKTMPPAIGSTTFSFLAVLFLSFYLPLQAAAQNETKEQSLQRLADNLQNGNRKEQKQAASDLGAIGKDAIPALIRNLKASKDPEILTAIAKAFGDVGNEAAPALIATLGDENSKKTKDMMILKYTANALANVAANPKRGVPNLKNAVPILMEIVENKRDIEADGGSNDDLRDFDAAADCLGYCGEQAKGAVPLLIELARNEKYRREKQGDHFRKKDSIIGIIDDLIDHSDFSANETIMDSFERYGNDIYEPDRTLIAGRIRSLRRAQELYASRKTFADYALVIRVLMAISLLFLCWLSILLLRPLFLLTIYESLSMAETRLPTILGLVTVPVHRIFTRCIFHPRVLDAWVKKYLPNARNEFSNKQTVKDRQIYVPIGLFLDNRLLSEFSARDLQGTFTRRQSRLVISGVGGAGKTSLACQVANWAMREGSDQRLCPNHQMIPVLLEQDLVDEGDDALKNAISAQLSDLIDADAPVSSALLQALAAKKRLLILIDGVSEMTEKTQRAILSGISRIPTNAVVFTSRSDEPIGELHKTVIRPTRITGSKLLGFVERYLTSLGKGELFEDEVILDGCRLLSKIVSNRDITPLLAKLFVEQMVAQQQETLDEELPNNVPTLMLQSIKVLYGKTPSDSLALRDVIRAAKVIAWECISNDYYPVAADYEKAKKSLANVPDGEKSLNYLKDKLKLIESTFFDEKIRFKIDPFAEYLAAMYLVEENQYSRDKWRTFIDTAMAKPRSPKTITGFLLALRDCCATQAASSDVPRFVIDELTKLTRIGT